jgi:RNA polymerase sigma-70 factor (ECF subfamily)
LKNNALITSRTEKDQKRCFHLLYGFAFKITVRYTGIDNDPEIPVYKAFAQLFQQSGNSDFTNIALVQKQLKELVILACIELEKQKSDFKGDTLEYSLPLARSKKTPHFRTLSEKEIVDILRTIPFILRAVYNLFVIDSFTNQQISAIMNLSVASAERHLAMARQKLVDLLSEVSLVEA